MAEVTTAERPVQDVPGRTGGWRWVPLGLAGGLVWGAVARAWMRYVSDDPAFTWAGTLAILGVCGLAGLALGTVEWLRRRGARGWRRLLALPALVMFLSPGMLMLPTALFGAVALAGRGPRWLRAVATVAAVAPFVLFLREEGGFPHSTVLSVTWYALLCLALATGWRAVILPTAR